MRRGLLRLVHPGPSVLVTVCFVAAAAAARPVDAATAVRLALVMLPLQFAIGTVNDVHDRGADAGRPSKPVAAGEIRPETATAIGVVLVVAGLGGAATFPSPALPLATVGLAAGLAYDLGLKRSPWSWLAWWVGFAVLPLCARAAVRALDPAVLGALPLAAGLSLCLLLANGLPDIAADRSAGMRTLAVRLGPRRTLAASVAAGGITTVAAVILAFPRTAAAAHCSWAAPSSPRRSSPRPSSHRDGPFRCSRPAPRHWPSAGCSPCPRPVRRRGPAPRW